MSTPAQTTAFVNELLALRKFKEYVHKRLDDAGVPTHPDGPHSKEGCRIGDRLDIVLEPYKMQENAKANQRSQEEFMAALTGVSKEEPSCKLPPKGWYCTRPAGHEGPCAAHPQNHSILVSPQEAQAFKDFQESNKRRADASGVLDSD